MQRRDPQPNIVDELKRYEAFFQENVVEQHAIRQALGNLSEVRRRLAAVVGTLPTHLCAAFAMVIVVVAAHLLAFVASGRAKFESGSQYALVFACKARSDAVSRSAYVSAI